MQPEYVRTYNSRYKRYCFALDLKDDPELISTYLKYHSPEHFWSVIGEGIKKAGIEIMDIYNVDNRLFMICEMTEEVDIDEAWQKMGSYERQKEWAALMRNFQQALLGHKPEWIKMNKVLQNPE